MRRSVLPAGHQMRLDSRLMAAAGLVAATKLQEALTIIDRVIDDEEADAGITRQPSRARSKAGGDPFGFELIVGPSSDASAAALGPSLPPLLVPALVYAQLLDRAAGAAGAQAPPAIASASPPPVVVRGSAEPLPPSALDQQPGEALRRATESDASTSAPLLEKSMQSIHPTSAPPPDSAVLALARYQLEQRAKKILLLEDALLPTARFV